MRSQSVFRRNVIIVACLHVGALLAFIAYGWVSQNPKSKGVMWLDGGGMAAATAPANPDRGDPAAPETADEEEREAARVPLGKAEKESSKPTAPSELVLPTPTPTATPKPAPSETPTPTPTPEPTPKSTPKPTPESTPKPKPKTSPKPAASASKSPKASPKKSGSPKSSAKPAASQPKTAKAGGGESGETKSAGSSKAGGTVPGTGGGNRGGAGKAGGGNVATDYGWYHAMIHDKFYSRWQQPTSVVSSDQKFVTTVAIRIHKDGSISNTTLANPSGNVIMDESVMAAAQSVTQIDPLPAGLGGDHYDVKINFELDQH